MTRKRGRIDPELIDSLLKDQDLNKVFEQDGLLGELKKGLAEWGLDAEVEIQPGHEDQQSAGNRSNGHSTQRVLTDPELIRLDMPRNRHSRFDPRLTAKYRRRFPGFHDKIVRSTPAA